MTLPLSILDLAPVPDGTSTEQALQQIIGLARLGDDLGYTRVWYAEHHGIPSIASSSPEVLIATAAAATSRIHVGSGGVMLPNHVPLRVVETYRTLNGLNPGRIDLGIGRAGGSDGRTLAALRSTDGNDFPHEMAELLAFEQSGFPAGHPFAAIRVVPENVKLPPIFILGSSGASAAAAGELGVGYSFAAHFSATPAAPAFAAYRAAFRPSEQFEKPHAIMAVSALVAPTEEEAQFLSSSQAVSWALFHSGDIRKLVSPEEATAWPLTPQQQSVIDRQGKLWIVGDPQQVKATIEEQAAAAGADEVMVTTTVWSHELRLRSYRLLAEAFGLADELNRPPRRDDGVGGEVDIGLGGRRRNDAEPHHPVVAPLRAAGKAHPVGLHPRDHRFGRRLARRRVAVAEIDDHLVEHDVVADPDARLRRQPFGKAPRQRAMPLDHRGDPLAAIGLDQRPHRNAAGPAAELGHIVRRHPVALRDGRQIARPLRHRPVEDRLVAHDRKAAIIRHLQPFVAVGDPGIGKLDAGGQMLQRWRGPRPQAERAIDMQPGVVRLGDRRDLGERIEVAGVDLARLGDDDLGAARAARSPPRAPRAACGPASSVSILVTRL